MPLFENLDTKITDAAVRQGVKPETLRDRICSEVAEAARQHFGRDHLFETDIEDGRLKLRQVIVAKDSPTRPSERATAALRAHGVDVEHDDALAFEVCFLDVSAAAGHDRQWGWLTGLVTASTGFGGVAAPLIERLLGTERRPDPLADAVRLAMLLATLPAAERESWRRHRLVGDGFALNRRRMFTLEKDVSSDEVHQLLERSDLSAGTPFELFEDLIGLPELLLGLLDPAVAAISRAARHCGVAEADVNAELKRRGLDLEQRTIGGVAWTRLEHAMRFSRRPFRVVAKVTQEYGEMTVEDARRLEPSIELGQELSFPGLERELVPDLLELFADEDTVCYLDALTTHDANAFERLRPTASPVPTPAPLAELDLGPLRPLYPEGHGVLFVDIPGEKAQALWHKLDEAAPRTGFRPVILGGDRQQLRQGQLAWRQESRRQLQGDSHPSDAPNSVLAAVDGIDVAALLAPGANPSYPKLEPERGAWPTEPSQDHLAELRSPQTRQLWPTVRLALIATDAAWKTIAYLPMLMSAGESTPSMAQACAVSREWEKRWGAKVASVTPATIEWWVERPPTRENALEIARAHFTFTPEGGSAVLEERANELVSPVWSSWWD